MAGNGTVSGRHRNNTRQENLHDSRNPMDRRDPFLLAV